MTIVIDKSTEKIKQSGLTLLEIIITIVIVGFAMAAIAAIFPLFQAAHDIEDADRFARKASGCAELIIACYQMDGEDAFNTANSGCGSGSPNGYEEIVVSDFVCHGALDPESVDDYCGNDTIENVACAVKNGNTYFEISNDNGHQPIYFGISAELE